MFQVSGMLAKACALGIVVMAASGAAWANFTLDGTPKAVFVYFNVKNDGGWVQALDEARLRVEQEMGWNIPYTEKVKEVTSEITPVVERYIQRGYNIILGSAFGYSDAFKALSERFPKVAFLNPAGITNGPNLQSYYGRTYESQYLCGMVAGAMSKSGELGFVAANPLGLVNWTVNAYLLGARKTNPDATLRVVYTGSWYDPVKERAAAKALIEQGVDVIGQHVDTPAVQVAVQEEGVYGTGHHRDMREFAPEATLCSSIWVWDRFLVPMLKDITAGQWKTLPYGAFPGISHGGTDIACCNDVVPAEVATAVEAERQAIIDGKHVFTGPIEDQNGKIVVAAGQTPSDADLWQMDYLIEGVVGRLK